MPNVSQHSLPVLPENKANLFVGVSPTSKLNETLSKTAPLRAAIWAIRSDDLRIVLQLRTPTPLCKYPFGEIDPRRGPRQPHLREVVRKKKQPARDKGRMKAPVAHRVNDDTGQDHQIAHPRRVD